MTREAILEELSVLEIYEKLLKDQLQKFVLEPHKFQETKTELNERINQNLDKLKIVWELKDFWQKKLLE